jgi:DNA-binding IclR family transcriptional regulator
LAVVSMSKREFDRLEVLTGVQAGRLRVTDACTLLGLSRRQLFRLLKGIREDGAVSLVSKRRGRPSNRRLPSTARDLAMALLRE